jgi:hypothetical protein
LPLNNENKKTGTNMRTTKQVNYVDYVLPEPKSILDQALPPETIKLLRSLLADKRSALPERTAITKNLKPGHAKSAAICSASVNGC